MKQKIFISAHYLEIGGAETSLIGLLHAFDYNRVNVDLFLQAHTGELMQYIPKEVNLLPEIPAYSMIEKPLVEVVRKWHWNIAIRRLWAKCLFKRYVRTHHIKNNTAIYNLVYSFINKCVVPAFPSLSKYGNYDLAISYISLPNIVLDKVNSKRKISWIHTDYSTIEVCYDFSFPGWAGYDNIISISHEVTKAFLKAFPELEHKIVEIENILPKAIIDSKVSDTSEVSKLFQRKDKATILVSVGRIYEAKNYDNIPYMAQHLKTMGMSFHWYIVGPGDHSAIDELSKSLLVDDVVTFLGPSSNPYPYINACDIYVHPSRYEGKSIVVREAQILCKPVIITNYPTAKSQIIDGVDGVICDMDNKKIAEAIYCLANDKQKQASIIEYLKSHDFAGESEVEKLYELINV